MKDLLSQQFTGEDKSKVMCINSNHETCPFCEKSACYSGAFPWYVNTTGDFILQPRIAFSPASLKTDIRLKFVPVSCLEHKPDLVSLFHSAQLLIKHSLVLEVYCQHSCFVYTNYREQLLHLQQINGTYLTQIIISMQTVSTFRMNKIRHLGDYGVSYLSKSWKSS